MRIPFLLLHIEKGEGITQRFVGIGNQILGAFPWLRYDLIEAGFSIEPAYYAISSFLSSTIWALTFSILSYSILYLRGIQTAFEISLGVGASFFIIFFLFFVFYPKVMAQKIADTIDRDLVFALRDMYIQISSGVSLFDAIGNISEADYGDISCEFKTAVKQITAGESEEKALEKIALRTKSEYLKRTIWQLVTSIKSGASLADTIKSTIDILVAKQHRAIKGYGGELNFLILIYLLFAAALPTIGITLIILLASFGGLQITEDILIYIVVLSFFIQIALIGFIKTRRPKI